MEKRVLYGLVVMLMHLVGSGFSQGEVQSEEAKWERFLIEAQQPIVVTLTSSLCGVPCAILEDQVAQLAKTYGNHITFYKADILEKPFLARLYKVVIVPSLIVFKDGKEIKRLENNFYWGAVYDIIFKENIFYSAPSPSDSTEPPSGSASPDTSPSLECQLYVQLLSQKSEWDKILVEAQLPILVMVTSSLCGAPCAILAAQVDQLAKTYGYQIMLYKTNISENPFFAELYKVLNVPAVIVFKDGKVIIRYENLSDWGKIYDLIFSSELIFDFALSPSDAASPLPSQSGE